MKTRFRSAIKNRLANLRREFTYKIGRPSRVLFDHLPKCAGTTLNHYLSTHYPERLVFKSNGRQPQQSVKEFQSLPQESRFAYQLVLGHLTHELLDYVHPETLTITVLRNPIDRIVSHYFYVKQDTGHYLHERVTQENLSLEDYVAQRLSDELQNWYTTHFSGLTVEEVDQAPEEALQRAAEVLIDRYDIIGFQDEFATVVQKLRTAARLFLPFQNETRNKTQERSGLNDISVAARNAIMETNSVDIKLFEFIKQQIG